MEGIFVEYFPNSADPGRNEKKPEFNSYISDDNGQDACDSHAHMIHFLKKKSGLLVSSMSTVWLETNGCAKQYMLYLATYLMTVISSLYGIIMYGEILAYVNGNNVVDVINATVKLFLKGKWNFLLN